MTAPLSYHRSQRLATFVRTGSFPFDLMLIESGPALTVGYLSSRPATTRGVGSILMNFCRRLDGWSVRSLQVCQDAANGIAKLSKSFRRLLLHEPINGASDVGIAQKSFGDFRNVVR